MASSPASSTVTLLAADAKPPKSKSAPYYSIHPSWQDVSPIPQVDQAGALAAIAYSPRYSEAMSYLRALMADNEVSPRALALTEDLISMNPAHYTVWIYRMCVLRRLWTNSNAKSPSSETVVEANNVEEQSGSQSENEGISEALWLSIKDELKWLDEISFHNLKNYQIWHHRHALADLLPSDLTPSSTSMSKASVNPQMQEQLSSFITNEQTFLAQILSLDTKNYHVWSYRQWLCTRFPSFLFPSSLKAGSAIIASSYRSHSEVAAMDVMIEDDIRNNSAWSHRYFLLFGHHELNLAQSQSPPLILKQINKEKLLHKAGLVNIELVNAEIEYAKHEIQKAPQNGSSWNYLKGVLAHGDIGIVTLREFCEEFLGPEGDLWTDQWVEVEIEDAETHEKSKERQEIGVRSSHAVEWLSDIYNKDRTKEGRQKAKECLQALGEKWDIIRKGYWDWRSGAMEEISAS